MDTSDVGKDAEIKSRGLQAVVKSTDTANRRVTALASTGSVDRYGEIVEPQAFAKWLPEYRDKNPVILAGHEYCGGGGECTVIGSTKQIEIAKDGLVFTMEFGRTPLAEDYWANFRDGHMRAFSVGFMPKAWKDDLIDPTQPMSWANRRRTYTEVELLEISAVAVPANRDAVVAAGLERDKRIADLVAEKLLQQTTNNKQQTTDENNALTGTLQTEIRELLADLVDLTEQLRGDLADPQGAYLRAVERADDGGGCSHGRADADAGLTGIAETNRQLCELIKELRKKG